jgi:hypothetical protein
MRSVMRARDPFDFGDYSAALCEATITSLWVSSDLSATDWSDGLCVSGRWPVVGLDQRNGHRGDTFSWSYRDTFAVTVKTDRIRILGAV